MADASVSIPEGLRHWFEQLSRPPLREGYHTAAQHLMQTFWQLPAQAPLYWPPANWHAHVNGELQMMHSTAAGIIQRYNASPVVLKPAPLSVSPARELPSGPRPTQPATSTNSGLASPKVAPINEPPVSCAAGIAIASNNDKPNEAHVPRPTALLEQRSDTGNHVPKAQTTVQIALSAEAKTDSNTKPFNGKARPFRAFPPHRSASRQSSSTGPPINLVPSTLQTAEIASRPRSSSCTDRTSQLDEFSMHVVEAPRPSDHLSRSSRPSRSDDSSITTEISRRSNGRSSRSDLPPQSAGSPESTDEAPQPASLPECTDEVSQPASLPECTDKAPAADGRSTCLEKTPRPDELMLDAQAPLSSPVCLPNMLVDLPREQVLGCALIGQFGLLGLETHLWENVLLSVSRMDRNALMATNSTMFELVSDTMVTVTTPRHQKQKHDGEPRRPIAIGRHLVSYHPSTGSRMSGTYVNAFENSKAKTVQVVGYNFCTIREFRDALCAAATVASKRVERLELVGCVHVDRELLSRLRDLFPWLRYVSIFNCVQFDLHWAFGAKVHEFEDLPFDVDIDFAEPSVDNTLLETYTSAGGVGWTDGIAFNALLQWLLTVKGHPLACQQPMMLHHIFMRLNKQYPGPFRAKDMFAQRLNRRPAFPKSLIVNVLLGQPDAKTQLQHNMLQWQSPTKSLSTKECASHYNIKKENSLACGRCNSPDDEDEVREDQSDEDEDFPTKHIQMFFAKKTRERIRAEGPEGDLKCYLGNGLSAAEEFRDDVRTAIRDDTTFSSTALVNKVLEMKKLEDPLPNLLRPTQDGLKALKLILKRAFDQKVEIFSKNYAWDSQFANRVALSRPDACRNGLKQWHEYLLVKPGQPGTQPSHAKEHIKVSAPLTAKAPTPLRKPAATRPKESVAVPLMTRPPAPTKQPATQLPATQLPATQLPATQLPATESPAPPTAEAPSSATSKAMVPHLTTVMAPLTAKAPTLSSDRSASTQAPDMAIVLQQVCAFNLTGSGPWNPQSSEACINRTCNATYHICKIFWSGAKKDGDHHACKHGGFGVDHFDSLSAAQVLHVLPSCAFEMPDKVRQGISCRGMCFFAHKSDNSATAFRVRERKFSEYRGLRKLDYKR